MSAGRGPQPMQIAMPINDAQLLASMAATIYADKGNDLDFSPIRCVDVASQLLAISIVYGANADGGLVAKYLEKYAQQRNNEKNGLISQ